MFSSNISAKLSLYDQIGYLLVGSVALLLLVGDLWLSAVIKSFPSFAIGTALVWAVVAYLFGHIIQAIANMIISEDKDSYSESDKQVLAEVREYFGKPDWTDKQAFQHCYILACGRDISGHVASVNAYYSLYRGWQILLAIEALFLMVWLVLHWFSLQILLMLVGTLLVTLLMNRRRKRYWNHAIKKALQTFMVVRRLEGNPGSSNTWKGQKPMKFTDAFTTELSEAVDLVHQVREVCEASQRLLRREIEQVKHGDNQFIGTAMRFLDINYDALLSIKDALEAGYLTQSYVLNRWHLEQAHLFYFLWKSPDDYKRWKKDEHIKPREVGEFFEERGFPSWEEAYDECSHVVHGNAIFIENSSEVSFTTPINATQLTEVNTVLKHLMVTGHKMNMIAMNLLSDLVSVSVFNPLVKQFESVETRVNALWKGKGN